MSTEDNERRVEDMLDFTVHLDWCRDEKHLYL